MRSLGRQVMTAAAAIAMLCVAVPASGSAASQDAARCSPDASLLGFTDSLDKTTFEGTAVAGLSALALKSPSRALALVDNIGTTPARLYDLKLDPARLAAAVSGMMTLRRADGVPYTGADFDGEGLSARDPFRARNCRRPRSTASRRPSPANRSPASPR